MPTARKRSAEPINRRMAAVRSKDTRPEMALRRMLFAMGFRYRLHRKSLPGCPDIVLPCLRTVVFMHGCFWHRHSGCYRATVPGVNQAFWTAKFSATEARDKRNAELLRDLGWNVIVVWECELKHTESLRQRLSTLLNRRREEASTLPSA
ncbi:very short patch repair endonuclease [Burkholderia diffusa]|uniref:very short patch repair endonuclease n=1 Tax=Burkholderia diffusa TaxID=488732 RepID=UPI002AB31AE4|nr:very short patch repair endonuclease [Burkholderia diffusa]